MLKTFTHSYIFPLALLLLGLTLPTLGCAQLQVVGSVVDKAIGAPVQFATVILRNLKDTTVRRATITDADGGYLFQN